MAELSSAMETPVGEAERLERRAKIEAFEEYLKSLAPTDQLAIDPMTSHLFASGVYCRRMDIPKDGVVVGGLHRTEHLAILLKGRVRITTEEGVVELEAPEVMVAPPGTKRVAYALTDAAWLSVHAVGDERDVEVIKNNLIAASHAELEATASTAEIEGRA